MTRFALALSFALLACSSSPKTSTTTPDTVSPPPANVDPSSGNGSAAPGGEQGSGADGGRTTEGCMCTMQYDPVCGDDGKTYGNACQAGCAKVGVTSKGECPAS